MTTPPYDHPPYSPGDVIVEEMPVVYSLYPGFIGSYCAGCFNSPVDIQELFPRGTKLSKCGRCGQIEYCGRDCQMMDWENFHKFECRILEKHGHKSIFGLKFARLYLRILLLMQKRPEELTKEHEILGGGKRCFMDLMDHRKESKNDSDTMLRMELILSSFKGIGLKFDTEQLVPLLCKYLVNSFSVMDVELVNHVGCGLYIRSSIFDHSCSASAARNHINLKIQVRAIKEIARNEPIYVSYCHVTQPRSIRQAELKKNYYFDCSCTRCSKQDEADDAVCRKIQIMCAVIKRAIESGDLGGDLKKTLKLYEEYIDLHVQVLGRYHSSISQDKVDFFFLTKSMDAKCKFSFDEILHDLTITHGPEHVNTKLFSKMQRMLEVKKGDQANVLELLRQMNLT